MAFPCSRVRSMILIAISLLSVAAPTSAADWEGIFQGTLGKSKIIAQLVEPLDDMEGETGRETSRYSYLPKLRDINLILKNQKAALRFEETLLPHYLYGDESTPDKKVTGHWVLKVKGDKATGEWKSPDGKTRLPISLSRVPLISPEEAGPDRNIEIATYDELWASTLTFTDAGLAQSFGNVELRWVKDSGFGIKFPVLGRFPDAAQKEKANAALLAAHHREVVQYRECKNAVPPDWEPENPEPEFHYEITYASPTVLSFTESGSVFCGGAHPSNYVKPITYDLTTGEQVGGRDLLDLSPQGFGRVLKLANKEQRIAFERFALDRWMKAAAQDKQLGSDCSTGWIENAPEGERDFKLHFTTNGLAITRTDYPHVISVCMFTDFNPTIIPWSELKQWLRPDQTLIASPG